MIKLVDGKKHQVIKRKGHMEEYDPDKMYKVLLWACRDKEALAKELLQKMDIKVFDKINISKLLDETIETAANLISDMFPIWDDVAKRLYLQKIYKETWDMKRSEYPHYKEVLKKGTQYGVYDKDIIESFSESDIEELNNFIIPEKDFELDYLGLRVFVDKQSKKYTPTRILELPQHGFMRLALFAFWKEPNDIRLELIKDRYLQLSSFMYSEATPKWMNSLEHNPQMASCVVSRMPDVSKDINKTASNMGLFSKHGGGLSLDITPVRSTGSKIGKSGKSSGPVPFIKLIESVVSAYNQNGCVSRNTFVKRIKEIEKDGITYSIKDYITKFGDSEIRAYLEPVTAQGGKGSASKTDFNMHPDHSKEATLFIEQEIIPFLREEYGMTGCQYSSNGGEFTIITEESKLLKYDFVSEDLKLIIEYHGTAFHPREGDTEWKNPFGKAYTSQFELDTLKKKVAEKMGYRYIAVYSDENKLEKIKQEMGDTICA